MDRPVAVLQKGFDVEDVVTMAAIAVLDSQELHNNRASDLAAD
jgi:phosphotransacetylase